jgi:hypothetical protein
MKPGQIEKIDGEDVFFLGSARLVIRQIDKDVEGIPFTFFRLSDKYTNKGFHIGRTAEESVFIMNAMKMGFDIALAEKVD